jgi:predicted metal-binding protein
MANSARALRPVDAAVNRAVVLICEKCGKRAARGDKNPSYRLASKLKKAAKQELDKGAVKSVLTSCLDVCPDDAVMVVIVPSDQKSPSHYFEAAVDDLDATCDALVAAVRRVAPAIR